MQHRMVGQLCPRRYSSNFCSVITEFLISLHLTIVALSSTTSHHCFVGRPNVAQANTRLGVELLQGLPVMSNAVCRCWKNAFWLVTLLYPRCSMTALQMFSYNTVDTGRCLTSLTTFQMTLLKMAPTAIEEEPGTKVVCPH